VVTAGAVNAVSHRDIRWDETREGDWAVATGVAGWGIDGAAPGRGASRLIAGVSLVCAPATVRQLLLAGAQRS
jgi:hypothetical protein